MAYAALCYLRHTLQKNTSKSEWDGELTSLKKALEVVDQECYRGIDRSEINGVETKIIDAAWKLEDAIDLNQISQGADVEQEIKSFSETAKKLEGEYWKALTNSCVAEEDMKNNDVAATVSQTHDTSATVGLSDLSQEIVNGLLADKMISIWGMAGIGKTHLARDICHHPLIAQHFNSILWVTVGPNYKDIKNIFVDILAQLEEPAGGLYKDREEHELRDLLQKYLSHRSRTYLIVLDDIWSQSILRECIDALPCSILLTTRLRDVVENWTDFLTIQMPFLSDEESWILFSRNVFGQKSSVPSQLEKEGRKIAQLCEGLPLLILTVADILRSLNITEEYWNKVANKKTNTFIDAYDRIYKVLVISYVYLAQKYKAHFLYMGVFRQSYQIPTSKLIDLWIAEGLLADDQQALLEVLVSNSIVIVCKRRFNSSINSCKLHCTYWYVCVTEARKMKFFHVLNKLSDVPVEISARRLSVQNNILFGLERVYESVAKITSLTRSLLFTGKDHQYPVVICFNVMILLKVLDAVAIRFYEFPSEVLNLLLLRYLALTHNGEVPSSISKLQRLQFLILRRHHNIIKLLQRDSTTHLPKEIWDLQKLQNLRIMGINLQDPSPEVELTNLSRLYVNSDSCTAGVFKGTPNLQKLGIEIELQPELGGGETLGCLEHTHNLNQVESLKCVVVNPRLSYQIASPPDHLSNVPTNLMKLSLNGMGYPWVLTSAIGSLPYLRVLKLRCCAFRGEKWEMKTNDEKFGSLEYLLLEDMDVKHWRIVGSLPKLSHLIVRHCYKLKMIPYCCFPNENKIELYECGPSLVENVKQRNRKADVIKCSWGP